VATCLQAMTVSDATPPVITCAAGSPFTRNNTLDLCGYIVDGTEFDATALDNCDVVSLTHNYGAWGNPNSLAGATFPVGETMVIWTAVDAAGNTTQCPIVIEVTDTQAPVFVNCPNTTFTISTDGNCSNEVIWAIPIATDNCGTVTVVETSSGGPYYSQPLAPGTYNIQYTATDGNMNTATCNFTVEVVDDNAPLLVCQPDLTVGTDGGVCSWASLEDQLNPLLAVDNCPGFELSYVISGVTMGSGMDEVPVTVFNLGVSTITYTLTDGVNPAEVCSFTVTVVDDELPVIGGVTCLAAVPLNTDDDACTANLEFDLSTSTDNCAVTTYGALILNPNGTFTSFNTVTFDYDFTVGVSVVTITVGDAAGNTTSCSLTVVVSDDEDPEIICPVGSPFARNNTTGECGYVTQGDEFDATAEDNCDVVSLTHNYGAWGNPNSLAGATFPVGETTVIWTAVDAAGNTTQCPIVIEVTDTQAPVFVNCPNTTFTISTDGNCSNEVIWAIPIATDNCGTVTVVETSSGGPYYSQSLAPGTYNIQYTATDGNMNTATCNFTVEVVDDNAPLLVCQPDLTVGTDDDECSWASLADQLNPLLAVDNCPGFELSYEISGVTMGSGMDEVPVTVFNLGVSTITYTLTDGVNPAEVCSFTVTVVDDELPIT
jgi:hypothetical protein